MELSSAIRLGHPIAFSLFIFFSLVVAIIASAVTADFNSNGGYDKTVTRDSTRFMVFTGWWSFLFGVIFVRINGSPEMPPPLSTDALTVSVGSIPHWHRRCCFLNRCSRRGSADYMDLLALWFCGPFECCRQRVLWQRRCCA